MKRSQSTCFLGGLLICGMGLGLPGVSYAVTGCTNSNLMGTYTAEVASANFLNVLNALNTSAGTSSSGTSSSGSGTTGSAGSSGTSNCQEFFGSNCPTGGSGGTTGSTGSASTGFVNNPFTLSGSNNPTTQFYFDGQGNVVGQNPNATTSSTANLVSAGTYSVSTDCSATISLVNGGRFNAVLVAGGAEVLFIQNNATLGGAIGTLQRSTTTCLANSPSPQSFGFSFFGAQQANSSSGSTGSTSSAAMMFNPYSAIGVLALNGSGGFTMREWLYQNAATTSASFSGNYTVGQDCSLSLTFTPSGSSGASTGSVSAITAPVLFKGGLVNANNGLFTVQPDAFSTITGSFIAQ